MTALTISVVRFERAHPFFAGPPAAIIAIGATITWREIYFDLAAAHFGAARAAKGFYRWRGRLRRRFVRLLSLDCT
jgi:hypothetical protein